MNKTPIIEKTSPQKEAEKKPRDINRENIIRALQKGPKTPGEILEFLNQEPKKGPNLSYYLGMMLAANDLEKLDGRYAIVKKEMTEQESLIFEALLEKDCQPTEIQEIISAARMNQKNFEECLPNLINRHGVKYDGIKISILPYKRNEMSRCAECGKELEPKKNLVISEFAISEDIGFGINLRLHARCKKELDVSGVDYEFKDSESFEISNTTIGVDELGNQLDMLNNEKTPSGQSEFKNGIFTIVPGAQTNKRVYDILKEYTARGTYIFPPKPSMRIILDIFEWCSRELPKWNTISVSGYHIREAGSTAIQELAFTLSNGKAYVKAALDKGLDIDVLGRRLSFFFNAHNNIFEEIAKFRAARTIWARIMKELGAKDPKSMMLRFHTQTAGSTLLAQQPLNNIARVSLQSFAARWICRTLMGPPTR